MARSPKPWTASGILTGPLTTLPTATRASPAQKSRAAVPHLYHEQSCLHSQLWPALSERGDYFDSLCGVHGQLRAQQPVGEAPVHAVDQAWSTLAPANPCQDLEQ